MYKIVSMSKLTTLGIGGNAKIFDVTSESQLEDLLSVDSFVLGNGSNILASDSEIKKPILRNRLTKYEYLGNYLKAQSGCNMTKLAKDSANKGLSGLEWAYGLPATVGGATFMNAGAFSNSVSDCVEEVEVFKNGEIKRLSVDECKFSYRSSSFTKNDFITSVTFRLKPLHKDLCLKELYKIQSKRKVQPSGKSAGCVYKAVGKGSGYYIDRAGLKGEREGDIFVSPIHAGFFINAGNGTAKQMLKLMEKVEKKVIREFGIQLEREIILVGDF